jgi:hypothetical protein
MHETSHEGKRSTHSLTHGNNQSASYKGYNVHIIMLRFQKCAPSIINISPKCKLGYKRVCINKNNSICILQCAHNQLIFIKNGHSFICVSSCVPPQAKIQPMIMRDHIQWLNSLMNKSIRMHITNKPPNMCHPSPRYNL